MRYSFVKDIMGSVWMMEPITLMNVQHLAFSAVSGMEFENETEPENCIPFQISSSTKSKIYPSDSQDESFDKFVYVLPVRDVIMKNDMRCGPVGTRTLGNRLLDADKDPSIIAHLMVFESGGGQAVAVPELSEAMQKCTKPIVSWIDGLMASAAMYIGSYSNEIYASREGDRVGCIGTMIEYVGRKAVSEDPSTNKLHFRIYADQATEKNLEYEAAMNDQNFKLVKDNVLNPHNAEFIHDIKANRPNVTDAHLKGFTFKAKDVVGSLIDGIKTFDDAIARCIELAGIDGEQDNSQNQKSYSMKQLNLLAVAAGLTALEVSEGGIHLSVENALNVTEQLNGISVTEAALAAANATIAERDATIATQTERITALENSAGDEATTSKKSNDDSSKKETSDTFLSDEDIQLFNKLKS